MITRHPRARVALPVVIGLLLGATGCDSILGDKLGRNVRVEVDPTIAQPVWYQGRGSEATAMPASVIRCQHVSPCPIEEYILATVYNEGAATVFRHRRCVSLLRRVIDGAVQPPESFVCAAVGIPPFPIEPGDSLVEAISVHGAEPGTYRVGFTLTDRGGELPESMTLSEPFKLP